MSIELPQFGGSKRALFEYHPVQEKGAVRSLGSVAGTIVRDAKHNLVVYEESRYDRARNKMGKKGFWDGFWDEAGSDYAALQLGVAIQSLENSIIDGGFDFTNHITVFNEAVTGIWELKRKRIPEGVYKPITAGKIREMASAAKEDPTFSIFFGSKRNLLPRKLRAFLHTTQVMPEIYKILPLYKEYAEGVLMPYEQTDQKAKEHGLVLDYFDDLIARLDSRNK